MNQLKCSNCGANVDADANFCPYSASALKKNQQSFSPIATHSNSSRNGAYCGGTYPDGDVRNLSSVAYNPSGSDYNQGGTRNNRGNSGNFGGSYNGTNPNPSTPWGNVPSYKDTQGNKSNQNNYNNQNGYVANNPNSSAPVAVKDKWVAILLAFFLGWLGIQFFYINKVGKGVACALLCWTGVPAIIGFFHCIIWLCMDDRVWQRKVPLKD